MADGRKTTNAPKPEMKRFFHIVFLFLFSLDERKAQQTLFNVPDDVLAKARSIELDASSYGPSDALEVLSFVRARRGRVATTSRLF